MAGRGVVEAQDRVADLDVVMLDRTLHWVPAIDPVHYDKPIAGVGPGHSFARDARGATIRTLHIGLIPAAVGGSPISSWEPGALDPATKTHPYDDALAARARRDARRTAARDPLASGRVGRASGIVGALRRAAARPDRAVPE